MSIQDHVEELRAALRQRIRESHLSLKEVSLAIPLNYTTLRVFLYGAPIQLGLLTRIEIWLEEQEHAVVPGSAPTQDGGAL